MVNNENNERVIGMADRTVYDTSKAQLLSTSLYADGKRKYGRDGKAQDLYLSEKDKYFFVEYSDDEKPKVRSVTCHVADAFIEKFGRTEQEAGTPA